MSSRRATALEMSEDGYAHVRAGIFVLHTLCETHRATGYGAFGHEYDGRVLALTETVLDKFGKLIDLSRDLRDDGSFCSGGDRTVERELA